MTRTLLKAEEFSTDSWWGADGGVFVHDGAAYLNLNPLTTRGDLYTRGASAVARLALGTAGQVVSSDGTDVAWSDRLAQKSLTVVNPTNAEDLTLLHADKGYTITKIVAVLRGSSTPSCTWTVRKNSDRSATGTEVVTGGTATTSTTTGSVVTSFNSDSVAAGDFVWLETTAKSGTVDELHVTVHMKQTAA